MDAEQISFPDSFFDKVISFCVIEHFNDDERVLRHSHRVLKPGGTLVLSCDSLSNPELTSDERDAHRKRYAVNELYTVESLGKKLERVGFDIVRHRYILTTPLTLALVRLTWQLDELTGRLEPLADAAYRVFNTVGRLVSGLAEKLARRSDTGLTLLVTARRRS